MQPILKVADVAKRWRWIGQWKGGRVRQDAAGRVSYVIERMRGGERYTHVLFVGSEGEADAEYALFLRDPARYQPPHKSMPLRRTGRASIDAETLGLFLAAQKAAGFSREHRQDLKHSLEKLGAALRGRDLRVVPLGELREILARQTATKHRIIALKAFAGWLRSVDRLRRDEDPTLEIKVPPSRAAQFIAAKHYDLAHVDAVYRCISSQAVRDVVRLRVCTGVHKKEIDRMARGECELRELNLRCGIKGTVRFLHKRRKQHILSLDAGCFAAARRLIARGSAPTDHTCIDVLDTAARRAEQERILPGNLRHTFTTASRRYGRVVRPTRRGVSLETIRQIVGHVTTDTTSTYYDGTDVPDMVRLPLKLAHADDPSSGTARKRASRPRARAR